MSRMFDGILQKGHIGNVELNNRMVMPAMGSSHGEADEEAARLAIKL